MGRTEYDPLRKKAVKKRTITSAIMIFVGIPLLIALSTILDNGKFFMIFSLGVVVCCMAPFFMVFEKRKPKSINGTASIEISALKPNQETIHAVTVVPILAPMITPIACTKVSKPALTKLTTITVVADED